MEALPEIDKKLWQQDPNAYARNYYKLTSKITVECDCGQKIKKCHYIKHLKSKNHKHTLLAIENVLLKKKLEGIV